jgi:hypothetical protein
MYQPIQVKTKIPSLINSINRSLVAMITLLCAAMASVQSVHAATITVINTNDSGAGSLRQALADANDGDTIDFDPAVTSCPPPGCKITLFSGELLVNASITISGPGADALAVGGANVFRVFEISFGKSVTISGLGITAGNGNSNGNGGGILNNGTLTVTNCVIGGNHSGSSGGGIYNNQGATLTVTNCIIGGNLAGETGGGIHNFGTLTVSNSSIGNNTASNDGGGSGGGICNTGTLTVTNSTVSGNTAADGGGISNVGGGNRATLTINSSTISANSATASGGSGGGIVNGPINAELTVSNSTISGNSAPNGGGIFSRWLLTIGSTILQAGASGANILSSGATVTSLGYNLSSDDASALLNQTGDQNNTDPKLGPLQDNGGPTFTQALLPGSPAIDKGKNFSGSTTDQRGTGFARTFDDPSIANASGGDGTDIGAFEVQGEAYAARIQQPINSDGSSVFSVRRGVVPVKFTLTLNGTATCTLPPATIALTRTAGGTTGTIDESVYSGSADTGSNFRIDSCQYVYNLSASALGVGTYRVDIMIDGQVVGSASFQLK